MHFDGKFAANFDTAAFMDSVKDRFTVQKGPLLVELEPRSKA